MNKTHQEVAEILSKIYESEFGGKGRGRFKISRSNLRRLSGRKRLEDTTIEKIAEAALDIGYIVIDLGDHFSVVEESVMLNYRPVPKSILVRFLEDDASSAESEDED